MYYSDYENLLLHRRTVLLFLSVQVSNWWDVHVETRTTFPSDPELAHKKIVFLVLLFQ